MAAQVFRPLSAIGSSVPLQHPGLLFDDNALFNNKSIRPAKIRNRLASSNPAESSCISTRYPDSLTWVDRLTGSVIEHIDLGRPVFQGTIAEGCENRSHRDSFSYASECSQGLWTVVRFMSRLATRAVALRTGLLTPFYAPFGPTSSPEIQPHPGRPRDTRSPLNRLFRSRRGVPPTQTARSHNCSTPAKFKYLKGQHSTGDHATDVRRSRDFYQKPAARPSFAPPQHR